MQCNQCHISCYSHGKRRRNIKDISNGIIIDKSITVTRYKCPSCGRLYNTPELESSGTSNLLKTYIIHQCKFRSYTDVSKETGCSDNTIKNIFHKYIENNLKPVALPPFVSISKIMLGNTFLYIIYDISSKKIIDATKNIDIWIQQRNSSHVKQVFCDICVKLLKVIKSFISQAKISIDINDYRKTLDDMFIRFFHKLARDCHINLSRSNSLSIPLLMDVDTPDDIIHLWPDIFSKSRTDYLIAINLETVTTSSLMINNFISIWSAYVTNTLVWKPFQNKIIERIMKNTPMSENHFKYQILTGQN